MKIILAKTAGFCMGVRRAVNIVLELVEETDQPIYTLGPLIHNPQVVELLKKRGVIPAQKLEEIKSGIVVIRSHGIRPQLRKELEKKGVEIVDATCPRVARVHRIVEKYSRQGYLTVILGDAGHSEVEGILGFVQGEAYIIEEPEQVQELPEADKVLFVAQTTQSQEKFQKAAKALRERYPELKEEELKIINTICDSTERRQNEVKELAGRVDAFVIVGGKESANTRRLKEIAEEAGKPAFLVETEAELIPEQLRAFPRIALSAGASTPNWMIRRVYEELRQIALLEHSFPFRLFQRLARLGAVFNFYLGIGAGLLALLSGLLLREKISVFSALSVFFYISAVHNLAVLSRPELLEIIEPGRGRWFLRHRQILMSLSFFGLVLGGIFAFWQSIWSGILYWGLVFLSLLYQVPFGRRNQKGLFPYQSLMDIPGSKDIFMALAWAVVIVLVPIVKKTELHFELRFWLVFLIIALMVLARSILQDFRDLQADRMVGKETLPILFGERKSRWLVHFILLAGIIISLLAWYLAGVGTAILGLMLGLVWLWLCVPLFTIRTVIQGLRAELLIDSGFILAGVSGLTIFYLT